MIAYALINLMMFRKAILYSKINLCKRLHPGSNPHTLMSEIQRKDPHISANFNPKCQFIIVKDLQRISEVSDYDDQLGVLQRRSHTT